MQLKLYRKKQCMVANIFDKKSIRLYLPILILRGKDTFFPDFDTSTTRADALKFLIVYFLNS